MTRLLRLVGLLAVVAVSAAACGNGAGGGLGTTGGPEPGDGQPSLSTSTTVAGSADELRLIVLPDETGRMPADVEIGCPSGPTFPAAALDQVRPLAGAELPEVEAAIRTFLDSEEGQFWPQDGWQILHESDEAVLLVQQTRDAAGSTFSFQTVERVDGTWSWAGGSAGASCPLRTRVAAELNTVEWRLDPAVEPPTPDSTSVALLVTERECASGQPMGERLVGPEIVTTDTAVYIAFAAEPPPGEDQNCPSNPEQSVIVDLPEALGDREIRDGLGVAGNLEDYLE